MTTGSYVCSASLNICKAWEGVQGPEIYFAGKFKLASFRNENRGEMSLMLETRGFYLLELII